MKKLIFLLHFVTGSISIAQNQLDYLVSTEGGSSYEVCYFNNYLYSGNANTLMVHDLSGPNQSPGNLTFQKRFVSNIDYITEHNGFLFVCVNHDGLWKFDITANPASPAFVFHYSPQHLNESVYDIAFFGDSIFVAAKTKVNLLLDSANQITFKTTVASYSGATRVRGLDIKDTLLAYTVALSSGGSQDGVYLLNAKNFQQLSFYNHSQSINQEVYFGQNTNLLHVMGGQITSGNLFDGLYYVLDYSNPFSLQLNFTDTTKGYFLLGSIGSPMNAKIINDTVYIATHGAGPINYSFPNPFSGQIYVYDARTAGSVTRLTDLYAGLYHFDLDINVQTRKMYVASEWYGILTLDVSDIYNEQLLQKTLTGGWSHGSAKAKNRLAEASEGYGVRLFDVSAISTPQLIAQDTAVGFCRAISISDSADYVYGWFLTGRRLRVFDGNNLSALSDTTVDNGVLIISDFQKSRYLNNKIAVIEDISPSNKKIVLADVSNPLQPFIQHYRQKNNVRDLLFHPNGKLFACTEDSLIVFDTSTMAVLSGIQPPLGGFLQPFKSFTLYSDTLYVYYDGVGEGFARYKFDPVLNTLTYLTATPHLMDISGTGRVFMASDNEAIYIGSTIDSLKALSRQNPTVELDFYDHGADFIYDNLWGVTDLYAKDGYVFLNEYMGQTTIFGPAPTSSIQSSANNISSLKIFPNPADGTINITGNLKGECIMRIFNYEGKLVFANEFPGNGKIEINTKTLVSGIYFISAFYE
jgi:hypothetical protein